MHGTTNRAEGDGWCVNEKWDPNNSSSCTVAEYLPNEEGDLMHTYGVEALSSVLVV